MLPDAGSFSQLLAAGFEQGNRLLDLSTPLGQNRLLAESMEGVDRLGNGGFHLDVTALSDDAHIPLKALLGQAVQLNLQTALGSDTPRVWHGYVTSARFEGANGGMARYRLRMESWLAFLQRRRDSFVFQDQTVIDIVDSVFGDYRGGGGDNGSGGQAALVPQWRWELRDRTLYSKRSLTIQYRESDFDFVERLLAEEGLFYWVEHQAGQGDTPGSHTVVIADYNDAFAEGAQASVRFHRADVTETEDTIQQWSKRSRWQTNGVRIASWDYRGVQARPISAQDGTRTLPNNMALLDSDYPGQYAYEDSAQGERLAHNALAAQCVQEETYEGAGTVRTLAAGQRFTLTDHWQSGDAQQDDSAYVVLSVTHKARNNLSASLGSMVDQALGSAGGGQADFYGNHFIAIDAKVEFRPTTRDGHGRRLHPRPTVFGTQTALVVGTDSPTHTDRDHRILVQFHWQRGAAASSRLPHPSGAENAPAKNELGTWVRVAEPVAGGDWGSHFVPRVGQEVLVQFLHGDIDRPVVVGALYNGEGAEDAAYNQVQSGAAGSTGNAPAWFAGNEGANAHNVVMSGIKTQALASSGQGSGGYNQMVLDDTPGQSRLTASTTQADSRLNLGHIKQQQDNQRLDDLGYGAELASREAVALRGGAGLLISADARAGGSGPFLDSSEAGAQIDVSAGQARTLAQAAQKQGAKLDAEAQPDDLPALKALTDVGKVVRTTASAPQASQVPVTVAPSAQKDAAAVAGGSSAGAAGKAGAAPAQQGDGTSQATAYSEPHIQFSAPGGIGQYTPGDAYTVAGNTFSHTAPDVNWTAVGNLAVDVAGGVVMFTMGKADAGTRPVKEQGLILHAAAGKVRVHSQASTLGLLAEKTITVASTHGNVNAEAKTTLLATAGGAYVRLEGGAIQLHAPGKVEFKSGSHAWQGPQTSPSQLGFSDGPLCEARTRGAAQQGGAVVPLAAA